MMWRRLLAIIAGLVAWALVATLIDRGLRLELPGYVAAEHTLLFSLPMKIARLAMAAVTSLVAGAVVGAIAPSSRWAPWIVGLVLLAAFLPSHVYLFDRFPLWYHLSFLVPLAPLVALGAALVPARKATGTIHRKLEEQT
jgi:hypothetical protein